MDAKPAPPAVPGAHPTPQEATARPAPAEADGAAGPWDGAGNALAGPSGAGAGADGPAPGPPGPQGGGRPGWGANQGARGPHREGAWGTHVPRPPASLARRIAAPAAALASVAAAFAYVGSVDPNEPGHYPACPLLTYTGLLCPGCGGLRSAHAFIHGDLPTALGANAAAVVGYGVFAVVWTLWLIRSVQGRELRVSLAPGWWWTLGGVLLVFSVVRNLPFGTALAP
ncbi:DUF2752 domain-containing protein [Streptomyces chengmaiensis]|uniref:DUF2752 domain-containing protein n=1 Tax=Streptomyces chengmaiensis TaxID=3040919 RepID=UPI0037D994CC